MTKPATITRLLLGLFLLLPAMVAAHPALWVVKDADTTIYLFGTVHLLPGDTDWRYPELERALAESQALYLEATDDDQANMAALVMRHGLNPGHPLSNLLSPSEAHRLRLAANKLGVPGGMPTLDMMRPWLAALTLTTTPLLKAGMDPKQGIDKQLKAQMLDVDKPVHALETAEQQIRLLAGLPQSIQLSLLRSTLRDVDKGPALLAQLVEAWKAGDTDTFARLGDGDMRKHEPELYRRMLVERNEAWAKRIASMLQQPGTLFVAVGAAHLAGPDSVQVQLRKMDIQTARQ